MSPTNGNIRTYDTDIAQLIDEVCERRGASLSQLGREFGCGGHSFISRIRSGNREPSRTWLNRFVVKCGLTKEEAIRAYEIFGYIPPGYRVVPMKEAA